MSLPVFPQWEHWMDPCSGKRLCGHLPSDHKWMFRSCFSNTLKNNIPIVLFNILLYSVCSSEMSACVVARPFSGRTTEITEHVSNQGAARSAGFHTEQSIQQVLFTPSVRKEKPMNDALWLYVRGQVKMRWDCLSRDAASIYMLRNWLC